MIMEKRNGICCMKIYVTIVMLAMVVSLFGQDEAFHTGLQPVEITSKSRLDKLGNRGVKIPLGVISIDSVRKGCTLGSIIECRKRFEVHEFRLKSQACMADSVLLKLVVERINDDGTFCNIQPVPITFAMYRQDVKREYILEPSPKATLIPGRYFIGIEVVDFHGKNADKILFQMYHKNSYLRIYEGDSIVMEKFPVNIGLQVAGIEKE